MNNLLEKGIVSLKTEFSKNYEGHSHLNEVIPLLSSELIPIESNDLKMLHLFAEKNPVYTNSIDVDLLGVSCRIYEGDINQYWLDSIKHDTSYAPFYPTWVLSAYVLALTAKNLGFQEIIDVGSGDGRISYCGSIIGVKSYGIEIDENLVNLQKKISSNTGIDFNPINSDATKFDYDSLSLTKPAVFLSGLPEVGEMLANNVISKILSTNLKNSVGFIFAGSHKLRENARDTTKWGWGKIISNFGLNVIETLTLPTRWTVDQPVDTPYVFTISNQS